MYISYIYTYQVYKKLNLIKSFGRCNGLSEMFNQKAWFFFCKILYITLVLC